MKYLLFLMSLTAFGHTEGNLPAQLKIRSSNVSELFGITGTGQPFIVNEGSSVRNYVSMRTLLYFIRTNARLDSETRKRALMFLKGQK